jgi:hypothetical protein
MGNAGLLSALPSNHKFRRNLGALRLSFSGTWDWKRVYGENPEPDLTLFDYRLVERAGESGANHGII